jgi:hypothetical protein
MIGIIFRIFVFWERSCDKLKVREIKNETSHDKYLNIHVEYYFGELERSGNP